MAIDRKIIEEIKRHNRINSYIMEQDAAGLGDLPPAPDAAAGDVPPAPDAAAPVADPTLGATAPVEPEVIDTTTDTEVEKIDSDGKSEELGDESSDSEELDITDLVNSQKNIENKQQEYFDMMFKQIEDMQSKLNSMEEKIEKYRPKTAQEKLELRTLDSGPFNQKLSSFFDDKQEDMEKSGKNEYVLTSDEVEQIVPSEIKKTFDNYGDEPTQTSFRVG